MSDLPDGLATFGVGESPRPIEKELQDLQDMISMQHEFRVLTQTLLPALHEFEQCVAVQIDVITGQIADCPGLPDEISVALCDHLVRQQGDLRSATDRLQGIAESLIGVSLIATKNRYFGG